MARPRLSPRAYRRITFVALVALAFIVVTGAAVRLTGSGLGCPDWPTCEQGRLVPRSATDHHAMVEFVNRTITGVVSVAVILAVLGSVVRVPRRRDLVWLSVGLVVGVVGQIVLGGLTVLFELAPQLVMGHFLLSMVLIANAVVLHHRAGRPDGAGSHGPVPTVAPSTIDDRPIVDEVTAAAGRVLVAVAAVALVTGTVVTATGPHAGDEDARRLDLHLPHVARIHGASVMAFLALTLGVLWLLHRRGAPAAVHDAGRLLLAVIVGQAAVGYTQYLTDVPPLLVGAHVAGAVAVWVAVLRVVLVMADRRPQWRSPMSSTDPGPVGAASATPALTRTA